MRKKLLITGFEPFGGEVVNPSWEAVKRLPDIMGDLELVKMQIPVLFGEAAETVLRAGEEVCPDAIICVGQAGGRSMITPEMVAINLRYASIADNGGCMPQDEPVVLGAPNAYFASLPVRRIVAAVQDRGISCGVSYSAGAYVCNDLFYRLLQRYDGTATQVGFIHVPYLPEQVEAQEADNRSPSMSLETIVRGLTAAIEAV